MAAQSRQYITLDSIINDYIDQSEQSISKYVKLWNVAYRGMEQMGLDFFYIIRSVKLPVLGNQTVQLPNNFLKYTKIGVLNSRGEVVPLIYNNKLTFYADQLPDRQSKTIDNTFLALCGFNTPVFYNYWNNDAFTNIYGVPSGAPYQGSFNIDEPNGVILLNEQFNFDYIILEYVASPVEGDSCNIPVQFREAMIAWLAWQDIQNKPTTSHFNLGDKRDRKNNFYNERRLANARYRPLYLEQAFEWNLQNTRMTVKS